MEFTAIRKMNEADANTVKRGWKIGETKKWFVFLRGYGRGRWITDTEAMTARDRKGEGVSPMMELRLLDDAGRMPS